MNKDRILQTRLTPAEAERLQAAADADHRTVSAWIRRVILEQLKRVSDAVPTKP